MLYENQEKEQKIAVYSSQGGVDPVGACVGQKGVRVQTVTNELGGTGKSTSFSGMQMNPYILLLRFPLLRFRRSRLLTKSTRDR